MSLRCVYRARQNFNITTRRVWESTTISTIIIRSTPIGTLWSLSSITCHQETGAKNILLEKVQMTFFLKKFFSPHSLLCRKNSLLVPCISHCDRLSHAIAPYFTLNSLDYCRDNKILHCLLEPGISPPVSHLQP